MGFSFNIYFMAIKYASKYNPSLSVITGCVQVGNIAVSGDMSITNLSGFFGGVDDTSGYIIVSDTVNAGLVGRSKGNKTGTVSSSAVPTYWRSTSRTDNSFINLCNKLPARKNQTPFTTTISAKIWLTSNGYWTDYLISYTYYRWQITNSKTYPPNANCIQASEFIFQLNGIDQSMSGVTVTNPNGTNPVGETPPNLVDGSLTTKALDGSFISNGNVVNFIFQFSGTKSFNGYKWATANDFEDRDPKSWTISGSNDGTNWTTLHTVTNFSAGSTRNAWQTAQYY